MYCLFFVRVCREWSPQKRDFLFLRPNGCCGYVITLGALINKRVITTWHATVKHYFSMTSFSPFIAKFYCSGYRPGWMESRYCFCSTDTSVWSLNCWLSYRLPHHLRYVRLHSECFQYSEDLDRSTTFGLHHSVIRSQKRLVSLYTIDACMCSIFCNTSHGRVRSFIIVIPMWYPMTHFH